MRPFLLILITLYINIYFPSCCWAGQKLILLRKRRWFCWWYSPSSLAKFLWYHYELEFPAVAVWYSRSTIMTMKVPVFREEEVSIRQFLKFSSFTKNPYLLIFILKLKGCVRYIFASLFCMSKREHLWIKDKCFLFHLESSFRSRDNQILTF